MIKLKNMHNIQIGEWCIVDNKINEYDPVVEEMNNIWFNNKYIKRVYKNFRNKKIMIWDKKPYTLGITYNVDVNGFLGWIRLNINLLIYKFKNRNAISFDLDDLK